MVVEITTAPIRYVGHKAIMAFELSGSLKCAESVEIDVVQRGIGPFVKTSHYRRAVLAMLWSELTQRIAAISDGLEADQEPSAEFEDAFNAAGLG